MTFTSLKISLRMRLIINSSVIDPKKMRVSEYM